MQRVSGGGRHLHIFPALAAQRTVCAAGAVHWPFGAWGGLLDDLPDASPAVPAFGSRRQHRGRELQPARPCRFSGRSGHSGGEFQPDGAGGGDPRGHSSGTERAAEALCRRGHPRAENAPDVSAPEREHSAKCLPSRRKAGSAAHQYGRPAPLAGNHGQKAADAAFHEKEREDSAGVRAGAADPGAGADPADHGKVRNFSGNHLQRGHSARGQGFDVHCPCQSRGKQRQGIRTGADHPDSGVADGLRRF